jgi:hypothetical protein
MKRFLCLSIISLILVRGSRWQQSILIAVEFVLKNSSSKGIIDYPFAWDVFRPFPLIIELREKKYSCR